MCLGTFSRRGAVALATIYPCAECASARSVFIVWKRSFLYDKKTADRNRIFILHAVFAFTIDLQQRHFQSLRILFMTIECSQSVHSIVLQAAA